MVTQRNRTKAAIVCIKLLDQIPKLSSLSNQNPQEHVKEHQKTIDRENPRDLIDAYLIEMEAQKNDPQSTMSSESPYVVLFR